MASRGLILADWASRCPELLRPPPASLSSARCSQDTRREHFTFGISNGLSASRSWPSGPPASSRGDSSQASPQPLPTSMEPVQPSLSAYESERGLPLRVLVLHNRYRQWGGEDAVL